MKIIIKTPSLTSIGHFDEIQKIKKSIEKIMYFYAQINKIILNKHTLLIFIWQKFCNFKKMTLAFDKAKRCFVVLV